MIITLNPIFHSVTMMLANIYIIFFSWSLFLLQRVQQVKEGQSPRTRRQLIAGSYLSILGIWYLAQGYLGSALKVAWPLLLPAHLPTFVHNQGFNQEPSALQPSPLQTELPSPSG